MLHELSIYRLCERMQSMSATIHAKWRVMLDGHASQNSVCHDNKLGEKPTYYFLIAMVLSGFAQAFSPSTDQILHAFLPKTQNRLTTMKYFGLQFLIDEKTSCLTSLDGKLMCQVKDGAQIIFEKNPVSSEAALKLLQFNRKMLWFKQYSSLNHYVEENIKIAGQVTNLQRAVYFRFDNINWPVLIRAFDVVRDNKTTINVTTTCDDRLWPANKETVENIEHSMIKTAK